MSKYDKLFQNVKLGLAMGGTIRHGIGFVLSQVISSLEYTNNPDYDKPELLSKIVEYQKARSQHFAMLYYVLGKATGLEVVIDYGTLYNHSPRIIKGIKDKEIEHYWCRIKLGRKEWIRVDPTANLVESSPKKSKVFSEHYLRKGSCKPDNEENPTKLVPIK